MKAGGNQPDGARGDPGRPSTTVVISTRNRGGLITETLRSLLQIAYPGMDILVVDQSTNDVTRTAVHEVAQGDPRVRLLSTNTVGSAAGRNLGACSSRSEIVAYTDDDCIVTPGWLDALAAEFADPAIAAVYGRLLPYEREEDQRNGTEAGYKPSLRPELYSTPTPPWYIGHGGNMAFRRRELLEIGAFDPLLGAGAPLCSGEDGDIAHRLLSAGKRIAYAPAALAYHKNWKDWPERQRMERAYGVGAGAAMAKYVRCGDPYGVRLLATWIWQLGVRRLGAGLLKWRSPKVMYLGYCQLVYPWIGVWRSMRYPVDRRRLIYVSR